MDRQARGLPLPRIRRLATPKNVFKFFPLRAGTFTASDWERLGEMTAGTAPASIGAVTTDTTPATLGERLRMACLRRGMTSEEVAAVAGLSRAVVYKIAKGDNVKPKDPTLIAIAKALDIDGWWLAEGKGEMNGHHRSAHHES